MSVRLGYLCSSTSWGGLEMNHLRNAIWMKERGHFVVLFCVDNTRLAEEAMNNEIPTVFIQPHKKYYDFKNARKLTDIIKQQGISHLLIRSTFDMSIAATVKRKLKDRIHVSYFMEMQLGVSKTNVLHTIRFKGIDLWSCPLNWLKDQVQTMTKYKNEIRVIPSGLDLELFNSVPEKDAARNLLRVPENALLFGLIGRFDPQKGQLLLLEAMKHAKDKSFQVVLLGEPTLNEGDGYFNEMNNFIEKHDLKKRVHIRPFMKNVSAFYAAMDWFVMATKAETFGMVTIESLACGTPVLGSNAGGTPEILDNERGGVLFETQNAMDLALKIDEICEGKHRKETSSLMKMAQAYDHNTICEKVEQALGITKTS